MLAAIVVAFSLTGVNAQKIKTIDGTPEAIKGDQNVNVIFTYDNLKVGKMDEAAYIEREVKEREDKEAGVGETWAGKWKADQQERYPKRFVELFNQYAGDYFGTNVVPNSTDSKYTMKVNISWIEPGYNIGISRRPAGVNMEIYIYETATPDKILHETTILNSPGTGAGGYDFDAGLRIQESFAKGAKEYAKFMQKKYFK